MFVVVSVEVVVVVGDIKGQFCSHLGSISDDAGVVVIFDADVDIVVVVISELVFEGAVEFIVLSEIFD